MRARKVVVGTDVLMDHPLCQTPPSLLRLALNRFFCYTTVFNAVELLAEARTSRERKILTSTMAGLKVLGLNARSALRIAGLKRAYPSAAAWDLLTAGLCLESRLPLLTTREKTFRRFRGLEVIAADGLRGSARRKSSFSTRSVHGKNQ